MPIRTSCSPFGRNGRGSAVGLDRERRILGRGVPLVEVVDELLGPDAGRIGQVTVGDEPPGDRVRGGVDIEGERRDAVPGRVDVGLVPGSWNVTPSYGVLAGSGGGWAWVRGADRPAGRLPVARAWPTTNRRTRPARSRSGTRGTVYGAWRHLSPGGARAPGSPWAGGDRGRRRQIPDRRHSCTVGPRRRRPSGGCGST